MRWWGRAEGVEQGGREEEKGQGGSTRARNEGGKWKRGRKRVQKNHQFLSRSIYLALCLFRSLIHSACFSLYLYLCVGVEQRAPNDDKERTILWVEPGKGGKEGKLHSKIERERARIGGFPRFSDACPKHSTHQFYFGFKIRSAKRRVAAGRPVCVCRSYAGNDDEFEVDSHLARRFGDQLEPSDEKYNLHHQREVVCQVPFRYLLTRLMFWIFLSLIKTLHYIIEIFKNKLKSHNPTNQGSRRFGNQL